MGDFEGFMKHGRKLPTRRPIAVRINDFKEVYEEFPESELQTQASRCMDCGVPFCNQGCPLGNIIPDWNDLVYRERWRDAIERLHATNNFPEFTGRLCPAPCEAACVLGINSDPVTIKQIELTIIEHAWEQGWVRAVRPSRLTDKRVAVIGSGPAGLAAAQQLTRAGHEVIIYERDDRIGGLLRYGIPEFKMEKRVLDRRLAQMRAEGTEFRVNVNVGVDITVDDLRDDHDAVVIATGSTRPRDMQIPGRELDGIHQAMEFLPPSNRAAAGDFELGEVDISAAGRDVVIIGGGDTGADCLGTTHRHGPRSVHQFEIMERPSDGRPGSNPWPTWPLMFRTSSAHEEGGERVFAINTLGFLGDNDGRVRALKTVDVKQSFADGRPTFEPVEGSEREIEADLVLLAMGFTGPETSGLLDGLGVQLDERGNISRDANWNTSEPGIFACGDAGRGQSLIVWAIAEGRACAAGVDRYLMGESSLPEPITPGERPLV